MACMGEIRLFAFDFAPQDWMFCDGKMLQISNNQYLFGLLGNRYGGDGINIFALPDMRGRVPVGVGRGKGLSKNWKLGEKFGEEEVRLTDDDLPSHNHGCIVSRDEGDRFTPENAFLSSVGGELKIYRSEKSETVFMHSDSISYTGITDNIPHNNMMPTMGLNYCICTKGTDPREEDAEEEPLMGEIKIFANNFAPDGFMKCDDSIMGIKEGNNLLLFALIQGTFGGDKLSTFNVPDLQGRVVAHRSKQTPLAKRKGSRDVDLTPIHMPSHNHYMQVSPNEATESVLSDDVFPAIGNIGDGLKRRYIDIYRNVKPSQEFKMNPAMLSSRGKGGKHENRQPYLALNYYICVYGKYPNRP